MTVVAHLKPVANEPDPEIVDALESALALAKEGKVRDIAIAWTDDEGHFLSSTVGNRLQLVGIMEMVKHRMIRRHYDKT